MFIRREASEASGTGLRAARLTDGTTDRYHPCPSEAAHLQRCLAEAAIERLPLGNMPRLGRRCCPDCCGLGLYPRPDGIENCSCCRGSGLLSRD